MSQKQSKKESDIFENCSIILDMILQGQTNLNDGMELLECALIVDTLNKAKGNNTQASKLLGLNRTTFVMKVRRLLYLKEKLPNKLNYELS